jgi:hypothetical protein
MKMKILATLVLGLVLTACSSNQPDWLNERSQQYPPERYLSAVGEADTRSTAEGRALANLAKIFAVAISDRSRDFSQARVASDQSGTAITNTQQAERHVTTEARQVLEGAQLVENWNSEEGKAYALAVLEKAPAERRFREGLRNADRQIRNRVNYASQMAPNAVSALAALEQARILEIERSNLNRNLSVVSGKGIKPQYDQASLEKLQGNALATLRFLAIADSPQLKQSLQSAIVTMGIALDRNAPYRLTASMDTTPLQLKQGWYWLRGSTELSLVYQGETLAKKRWPLKVSATDKAMVGQRARDKLSEMMTTYLYELLTMVE